MPQLHTVQKGEKGTILRFVAENGQITRKQAEELISSDTTKAYHLLTELCNEQKLKPEGNGRDRRYVAGR